MMHEHRLPGFTGTVAIAVSLTALSACHEATPRATESAPPLTVSAAPATRATLVSQMEAGGVVTARTTAVVASRIMAPVVAVQVRAGDRVTRGMPLVMLDGRELNANRARAAATVASAIEAVRAAQSEVRSAEAVVSLARTTHDRVKALHDSRSATTQELDQAASALDVAEAQLAQARAHEAAANASVTAARASSEAADVANSYTTLTAPFDGIVTERTVDPGSMATPGATLLTVEDVSQLQLAVVLDESRAAHATPGDEVDVAFDGGQFPTSVSGHVREIARIDPTSHAFTVKIDLPPVDGVRSGTFGRARFKGATRTTLVIPASAVVRRGQLVFVFTVDQNDRARLRAVSPGDTDGDRLEILAGLSEGDSVITTVLPALRDGHPVTGARP